MTMPRKDKTPNGHNRMKRCECGCGQVVRLAPYTHAGRGWIKSQPIRFVHGHHARKQTPEYVAEDRGYTTLCWVWQRATHPPGGYGVKYVGGDRQRLAHRVYYEQHVGPIPKGLHIDHLCGVPACVNPDHLEAVTPAENVRRGKGTTLALSQVRELVLRRLDGERTRALAEEFGIDPSTASALARGAEAVLMEPT